MTIHGSPDRRLSVAERRINDVTGPLPLPILAQARRVRIAKTKAKDGESYPPEGSTAFPIVFVDASFTPVDETAVATFTERTTHPETWAYTFGGHLPEGATIAVMRDNDLEVDNAGAWFLVGNCCVIDVRMLNDSGHPRGLYYKTSCDPDTWVEILPLVIGECSNSSGGGGGCSTEGYDPGSGWTNLGAIGGYDAYFSNPGTLVAPADPPSGSWTFTGGGGVYTWYNADCNWFAEGATIP